MACGHGDRETPKTFSDLGRAEKYINTLGHHAHTQPCWDCSGNSYQLLQGLAAVVDNFGTWVWHSKGMIGDPVKLNARETSSQSLASEEGLDLPASSELSSEPPCELMSELAS